MSSGSILLQQLRSRQSKSSIRCTEQTKKKSTLSNDNCNSTEALITSSCDDTSSTAPAKESNVAKSNQTVPSTAKEKKKKIIEVCLGPDCAVAGGGAALLEIEDLVTHHQCPNNESGINNGDIKIIVQAGGCRDQCTEGPNVRILSNGGVEDSFHRVNNPEACRSSVVGTVLNNNDDAAICNKGTDDSSGKSSSSNDVVARLLQRKEDARRWKAHRERASKERRLQAIARNQGA